MTISFVGGAGNGNGSGLGKSELDLPKNISNPDTTWGRVYFEKPEHAPFICTVDPDLPCPAPL